MSPILIATTFVRSISSGRVNYSKVSKLTNYPPRTHSNFPLSLARQFHASTHHADMYWNRETSQRTNSFEGELIREARIIALSDPDDAYNEPLYNGPLPNGSKLLAVGASVADFDKDEIIAQEPNVMFVSHPGSREPLIQLLEKFPSVEWVHTRSAGIDFIASGE
jgi:hypothetical protein